MADQLGLPRPGDAFIGVIEFFSILVPGVAAALLVGWGRVPLAPNAIFWLTLLIAGFVLGHVLNGLGSFLDIFLYDPLFKPIDLGSGRKPLITWKYFRANDDLYRIARQLSIGADAQASGTGTKSPPGGMFQWARTWLRLHSPEATAQLDRLEADSKLFRGLAVLVIGVLAGWPFVPHCVGNLWLAIAGLIVFLWRYCDLRQKLVRSCYLQYLQLRYEAIEVRSHTAP